ncbi:MAG TPA: DUF4149 domain-containing protein [Pyrinomonadaceae bacterium]|nr:DUF4149 domain-containing protein [Pyrinomonadaceae bacterium]
MSSLKAISIMLISAWLGAALFFSAVVAPAAFAVLRVYNVTNAAEVAGGIVNRSLGVINVSGFLISVLVLAFMLFFRNAYGRAFLAQLVSVGIVALMTAVGHWLIAARMRALRAALELPIDQLALTDPRRVAFGNLHRYSVIALAVAMLAALIVSFLFARSTQSN